MSPSRPRFDVALLAGLALAVATLLFFAWLAWEVMEGDTRQFDFAVRSAVHSHASVPLTWAMRGITLLGSTAVLLPAGALLVAAWVRRGRKRAALLFGITMAGALLLDMVLKIVFHRPRPVPFFGLAAPLSYSFPSGHALVSCCFYTALVALAAPHPRRAAWLGAGVLVGAIGLSRIYLGVHYPSDVLAGYAAAVVWVLAVRSVYRVRRPPSP